MPRKYFGIDVIRLLAASMVLIYHLGFFWWTPGKDNRPDLHSGLEAIRPITSVGWVGVEIFFVISGFVIAMSAQNRSAKDFLIGRALRLYPAAWVCGAISFFVAGSMVGWPELLRSMVLWPVGPWVDGAYWTIAIEMTFYTLVGLVLAIAGSAAIGRLGLALGLYSGAFWASKVLNSVLGGPLDSFYSSLENEVAFLLLLHFGCFFALGMSLFARRPVETVVFGIVCLVAVAARSHAIQPTMGPGAAHWLAPALVWAAATILIGASVIWADWIAARVGRFGGAISTGGLMTYPVYLVHDQLGKAVVSSVSLPPYLAFAAGALAVFVTAYLALLAERRIRAVLRVWLQPAPKPAAQQLELPG
jgi:peptidoglycan/LPS O-acetylase OafA/YrhL